MPREKKDARAFNILLATPTYEALERFCRETGLSKTAATEKIMDRFFEEYFSKDERGLFKDMKRPE